MQILDNISQFHFLSNLCLYPRASYGQLVVEGKDDLALSPEVVDVTIPLQCLVKDSKLILQEASKVSFSYPLKEIRDTPKISYHNLKDRVRKYMVFLTVV